MNSKAGRNIEDTIKKVIKCSRIEVVNETTNNENPFFEVLMTQTYAHGHILVSNYLKMSTNLALINITNL